MKKFLSALCFLAIWLALSAAGHALSDPEYREMMKDEAFAAADRGLNEVWAEAKELMPKAEFEALKKEQKAWNAKGRDAEAKALIEDGMNPLQAYTSVTEGRALTIRAATSEAYLKANPVGAQGLYVRKGEDGKEDGWLKVYWRDRSRPELEADIEAVLVLRPDNVRTGALSGRGDLKDGVVEIVDAEDEFGRMVVTFKGDTATVTTTDEFKQGGWCGMGVELDGTYVRQKLKR